MTRTSPYLLKPIKISGQICHGSHSIAVKATVAALTTGRLSVRFSKLRLSNATAFLLNAYSNRERLTEFEFRGHGQNGESFETKRLVFLSLRMRSDDRRTFMLPKGECITATLTLPLKEPCSQPILRYYLCGFKCFRGHVHVHPLGKIVLKGTTKIKNYNNVTGDLAIQQLESAPDPTVWRKKAAKLLDHVTNIISFASGTYLRVPIIAFVSGSGTKLEFIRTSDTDPPFLPSFHFLNLGPIFKTAVNSFEVLDTRVTNLRDAIEWFLMPATYDELRIITRMTALENLVSHNSSNTAGKFLTKSKFKKLARLLAETVEGFDITDADKRLMRARIAELNRRSLLMQIDSLLKQWGVPLHDLPAGALKEIVEARNDIVHRGIYYTPSKTQQKELWHHVVMLNEILTRTILSRLNFEGGYFSHIRGEHQRHYPKCTPM